MGTTPDALAIAAVMARPWADAVLSGASTVDQLASNLAASAIAWDDEAEQALVGLAEDSERYWSTRSRLPWN